MLVGSLVLDQFRFHYVGFKVKCPPNSKDSPCKLIVHVNQMKCSLSMLINPRNQRTNCKSVNDGDSDGMIDKF